MRRLPFFREALGFGNLMHCVKLMVLPANKEDVYIDTARIPEAFRGGIREGVFCTLHCNGERAFVALRSSEHKNATIKIDETTRMTLGVDTRQEYEFGIDPLGRFTQFLPLWYASNPFTRFVGRITMIAFALGAVSVLPILIDFVCWLDRRF